MTRLADGTARTAPREVIHLLNAAREVQLNHYRLGKKQPEDNRLIDRFAIQEALPTVSGVRYKQTLCAEHPSLIPYLSKLEREKSEQNIESLRKIWNVDEKEAIRLAEKLVDVGFFTLKGTKSLPLFWVPYIYRDALRMVQGSASRKARTTAPAATDVDAG